MARRNKKRIVQKQAQKPASGLKGGINNSVQLDPKNPIPLELGSRHIWITRKGKEYIPFLNPTDTFAQLLLEAKLLSPTNMACVGTKAEYCLGMGVFLKDLEVQPQDFLQFTKTVNRRNHSLDDIVKGAFEAYYTCGNAYIEVVRGEILGTRFIKIYKRNFMDCKLAVPDEDDFPTHVFISRQFRSKGIWSMDENEYVEVPIWSPNMLDNPWVRDSKGFEHTIFHLKHEIEGYDDYGMPSNVASLPQQILEYKSARYNLDNFENNLVIGGTIILKGQVSDEEAQAVAKNIIYQHTGDGKRGRFVVVSSETGGIEGADVVQNQKQTDASFLELDRRTEEKIISANQWDAILAGIHKAGGLGATSSAYIRSVFDIKKATVIGPAQSYMVRNFLEPLMHICNEFLGVKWAADKVALRTVMPITFLGDIDVNSILTKNEGREIAGLPVVEEDKYKEFIKSGGPKEGPEEPKEEGGKDV